MPNNNYFAMQISELVWKGPLSDSKKVQKDPLKWKKISICTPPPGQEFRTKGKKWHIMKPQNISFPPPPPGREFWPATKKDNPFLRSVRPPFLFFDNSTTDYI